MERGVLTLPVKNGGERAINRDHRGRFVRGTAAGPGRPRNPFARRQASLRQALQHEVTDEDVRGIVRRVIQLAIGGDLGACRLFFEWIIGELPPAVHPDDLDAHELSVARAAPSPVDQMLLAEDQAAEVGMNAAAAGWEAFAERHLEWGPQWAVPLTYLYGAYRDWCARYDEPVLPQADMVSWLEQQGATVRGGDWPAARGVRVVG